jgi:cystathionine beta-lyase
VLVQPPVFYDLVDLPARYGLRRLDAPLALVDHATNLSYELEMAGFRQALHGAGSHATLFLLCNPHNPVGKIYRRDELESMAAVCLAHGMVICSDEIHHELVLGDAQFTPVAAISAEVARRTITLVGPGKAFNVSGLGCAFAIIPDEELRRRYAAELERGSLEPGSLGLAAARAAYSGACDEWLAELCAYLTANRDFLVLFLREELPALRMTIPEATYLAWIDCRALIAQGSIPGKPQEFFIDRARVALYDGEAFGPGGEGFVRLNFACPRSILEEALWRIKRSLPA